MGRWVTLWLHLVGAGLLLGGSALLALAVFPYARRLPEADRAALLEGIGRTARGLQWIALVLLLLTGLAQLLQRGLPLSVLFRPETVPGPFGRILAWKLALFWLMVLLTAFHDLYLIPRMLRVMREVHLSRAAERAQRLAQAERIRSTAGWIGRFTFLLLLAVLYLGVALSRA